MFRKHAVALVGTELGLKALQRKSQTVADGISEGRHRPAPISVGKTTRYFWKESPLPGQNKSH